MSGAVTVGFRERILDYVFRGTALGFSQVKVCLTRRVPMTNAAVSQLDEPSGLAYARVTRNLNTTDWAMTLAAEVANATAITFPTATGTWGVLAGWAVISVESSPIVLMVGTLAQPWRVVSGIRPVVPIGGLVAGLYD